MLVAVNPTRGLDVGSARFVHEQLLARRAAGGAVLLISTELDEVLALADRLVALVRGELRAIAPGADRAAIGAILLGEGGGVSEALLALLSGSVGSVAAWTATLRESAPLLITGLAVALAFRGGVWNIGAEGQLLAGALCATVVATRWCVGAPALLLVPAVALAGAFGGALFGGVAGGLRAARGVSEVISTILLNFVASCLVALAIHGPLQEASRAYPKSDPFPAAAMLPALGRVHAGSAGGAAAGAARAGARVPHAVRLSPARRRPRADRGALRRHLARAHGALRRSRSPGRSRGSPAPSRSPA